MKIKLFGGPHHGQEVEVQRPFNIRLPNPVTNPTDFVTDESIPYVWTDTTEYGRHKIRGSSQTFELWAPIGWDGDDVVQELLTRAGAI